MSNVKSLLRVFDAKGISVVTQTRQGIMLKRGDVIEVTSNGQWRFAGKFLSVEAAIQARLLGSKRVVVAE
jgi:hypothetical protein